MNPIARLIKRRRKALGLSQKELSVRLGLKHSNFLTAIETGKAEIPLGRWRDFARALETNENRVLLAAMESVKPDLLAAIATDDFIAELMRWRGRRGRKGDENANSEDDQNFDAPD
jgi:predicted transcriptional regulator